MNVKDIQIALKEFGFDPGPIDGIPGRRTTKAIKLFQKKYKLVSDGLVGPRTAELLFPGERLSPRDVFEIPVTMPWVETAYKLIGTQERPGIGSNEAIIEWAEDLELTSYSDDDIPWCGCLLRIA